MVNRSGAIYQIALRNTAQELAPDCTSLLVIDGGHAPENQTEPIRRFGSQLVLLVDAAFVGDAPGAVALVAWQEMTGLSATTHTMPLHMLAQYLVGLLGIQRQQMAMGICLSESMETATAAVVAGLREVLGEVLVGEFVSRFVRR